MTGYRPLYWRRPICKLDGNTAVGIRQPGKHILVLAQWLRRFKREEAGQCMEDRGLTCTIFSIDQQIFAVEVEMRWGRSGKGPKVSQRQSLDAERYRTH